MGGTSLLGVSDLGKKKKKDFIVPHVKTLTVPCYRDIFKRFNLDVDVIEAKQS